MFGMEPSPPTGPNLQEGSACMGFVEPLHLCVGQALKVEQQELRKATMVLHSSYTVAQPA